jgi:hypothetical protein
MATGWAKDGAVQDQIDDTIADAVQRARALMPKGESPTNCIECGEEIPEPLPRPLALQPPRQQGQPAPITPAPHRRKKRLTPLLQRV